MSKLEKALVTVHSFSRGNASGISATAFLIVTIVYLAVVLSVPLYSPQVLIWLALYPVVQSEVSGIGYGCVFIKSLWVLPLVLLIGIFNPVIDTSPAFSIGNVTISSGWISFISLTLRGILAVQAAYILNCSVGFYNMCHSLRHLGCPKILITQLQFTYRYMAVLMEEALWMDRARRARGFGNKDYPLRLWGTLVGELFIRSYDRAYAVNKSMLSRGFNGAMPASRSHSMSRSSWWFMIIWILVILIVRFIDISSFFARYAGSFK